MIADGGQSARRSVDHALTLRSGRPLDVNVTLWNSPADGGLAGGDWCDVVQVSEDETVFTIGDVSGYGESVAGVMEDMRASVLRALHPASVPSSILAHANSVAVNDYDHTIVTAIVAIFNHRLHTLAFANAGHPPPLLLVGDRHAFLEHPPADLPLGIYPNYIAANYVIALPRDVLIVFYTDGIPEHERDPIQGETELAQAVRRAYERPESGAASLVAGDIFRNSRGHDDAAVMALRVRRSPFADG